MEEIFKQLEQKLEEHGKEMRGVSLSASEKNDIREKLEVFVHAHPVNPARAKAQRSPLFSKSFLKKIRLAVASLLALSLSGGVSYAAEGALPGDTLYPVKTDVNEKVRVWAAVSDESKAKLQAELAERRLSEAEQLAVQGRLDTETQTVLAAKFEEHAKESQAHTEKVEEEKGVLLAANIQSDFEAALDAHEKVLVRLEAKHNDATTTGNISVVLSNVRTHMHSIAYARATTESKILARAESEVKISAEDAMKSAEEKIGQARKLPINEKNHQGDSAPKTKTGSRVSSAEKTFEEAKAKLDAGSSGDAFSLFMKAGRKAQSAKLLNSASKEFNIDVDDNPEEDVSEDEKEDILATSTASTTPLKEDNNKGEGDDDGEVSAEKKDL